MTVLEKLNLNKFRLFIKSLVTVWVPVAILSGILEWSPELATGVMAASVVTVDGFFAIFGVEDTVATGIVKRAAVAAKKKVERAADVAAKQVDVAAVEAQNKVEDVADKLK